MFKDREFRLRVNKIDNDTQPSPYVESFEQRVGIIFRQVERIGVKVFAGVCVYVLLDTHRKTEVEKARRQ